MQIPHNMLSISDEFYDHANGENIKEVTLYLTLLSRMKKSTTAGTNIIFV